MSEQILVTRSSMPTMEEYIEEIRPIWESHWLTNMGEKHEAFQLELQKYMGVPNVELLTNGHMALELSLQAMNLQGEVITTPFTFASTTHAIVRNGLEPVFCDIDPETYTMDVTRIERLITDRTCAILPVHVYGNICNMEEIERIAHKYELKVVYDAAHTFGETYKGRGIGNFGDASCFSFHATKVFNTIEGGAVCYRDPEMGRRLYELKNFGIHGPEEVDAVGANAKMNEFCAAMGLCNLRHVDEEIAKRKVVVERYLEHLEGVEGLHLSRPQPEVRSNYAYFPVVFDEKLFGASRNEVDDALAKNGIGARKYFYPLTNTFECFHNKYDVDETPVALHVAKRVLINDAGDNSIVLFGGANRTIDETFIDRVTSAAKPGDILLLQNEITNIDHAMEAGQKAGMRVAFNFAPFDPKLAPELPLSLCDYLFLNRIEAGGIAGQSDVEEILETLARRYPETELVLTLGPEGAVALTPAGQRFHADSPRVKVVETTAAGDTFIGYYLAAVLDGFDTGRALERACRAAALCCSRAGAAESIPTRADLDR